VPAIGMGCHIAARRHPDAPMGGNRALAHFIRCVQAAGRGLFDIVFLADGAGIRMYDEPPGALSRSSKKVQFEPLTLVSALAMVTTHIGLIAAAGTIWNEPCHIARRLASLHCFGDGRAAWGTRAALRGGR
jgi:alkanesulfonate monooxygenase SsuD/methylene tetrahydromethanopterin reductase-like flavin-dependent oxidoreductase (luciferase family)